MPKVSSKKNVYETKYDEHAISQALRTIKDGMGQIKVRQQFNVPRATLQFRTSEKFRNKTIHGPKPILKGLKEEYWKTRL
ncbi:hypothetical protein ILUMI_19508 [Ignelater luminosus]|uniref:HTH psq-type domain-containing protein n=1 Tax=Ignelater luminosus TaxID=2038154 RepID=A0A8K0FZU7_IGNLU|nr:hypothetical protein ILUMI_19508 [Ignelater luminosus]